MGTIILSNGLIQRKGSLAANKRQVKSCVNWRFDADHPAPLADLPQLTIPSMREEHQYALHANNLASWPVQVSFTN